MNITQEQFEEIKTKLQFYIDGDNIEWDGCKCHGHWTILDHGEKAQEALTLLEKLWNESVHREPDTNADEFKCAKCSRIFDIEDSVKIGDKYICMICDINTKANP